MVGRHSPNLQECEVWTHTDAGNMWYNRIFLFPYLALKIHVEIMCQRLLLNMCEICIECSIAATSAFYLLFSNSINFIFRQMGLDETKPRNFQTHKRSYTDSDAGK